jgi:transglutaminase-like putative cysteine protease
MPIPALPPRRSAPPPPPRAEHHAEPEEDEPRPMGIAARIASLKLNQVGRTGPPVKSPPPPPPVPEPEPEAEPELEGEDVVAGDVQYEPPPVTQYPDPPSREELTARGPDFMRAIRRKPPPIPTIPEQKPEPIAPPPPARRLPPMPARLPTPPPEAEPEQTPEDEQPAFEPSCLSCHDFSHVDDHAACFPRQNISSLDQLAYDLTAPWGSETEKFRAIFTWLHHNIAYDCQSFFSGNIQPSTAESTLQSGLAVCDGYAGLFKGLADRAGLQAHRVSGHGKGLGYTAVGPDAPVPPFDMNHAWNCVLMDGQWHLIDSCWGAGAVNGPSYTQRFAPMWFTMSPRQFGRRHFPEDPSYQLLSAEEGGSMSWEEYILVAEGPTLFNDFYTLNFAPDSIMPAEMHVQRGQWVTFRIDKLCEHMSRDESDNWVYFLQTPDEARTPLTVDEYGCWSAQVYIRDPGDISLYYVTTLDRQDAKGIPVQKFVQSIGRKAMTFGGLARWTVG